MELTSITNKARSLELKTTRMLKEPMLDKTPKRIKIHSNGLSDILIR
jgi:hypothetical protein